MITCDLNCDMGEGTGNDKAIMPFITSANIACGYHAGNEAVMRETILQAKENSVAIGAHPSFLDRENFGRTAIKNVQPQQVYDLVTAQIKKLHTIVIGCGASLHHVKPHGALYNMAAKDAHLALAIAHAVYDFDKGLILYGLSGSHSIKAAQSTGLVTASEVFADRTYQDDGSLTPRSQSNALIEAEQQLLQQVLDMIKTGTVITISGKKIPIAAQTICLHGDGKHAVQFAAAIHKKLGEEGIKTAAPHPTAKPS